MVGRPHRDPNLWVPASAHHRLTLAIKQCDRWRDSWLSLTEEAAWHFRWLVIDERSGLERYEAETF